MALLSKIVENFHACDRSTQKKIIFISIILFFSLIGLVQIIYTRGDCLYDYYVGKAYFSDFYSPMTKSRISTYIEPYYSNYPPLANMFFLMIRVITPSNLVNDMNQSLSANLVFAIFMIITSIMLYLILIKSASEKSGQNKIDVILAFIMLLSAPFLFLYLRGNILVISLICILFFIKFYESENKVVKELSLISLAIATALKIYPVVFGLLLIKKENKNVILRTMCYGAIFMFLPFFAYDGFTSFVHFIENLFMRNEGVFYLDHVISLGGFTEIMSIIISGEDFRLSYQFLLFVLAILIFAFVATKEPWKKCYFLCMMIIWIPHGSYVYNICFLIIPLLLYLKDSRKKKMDLIYLIGFALLFIPYYFPPIDTANAILAELNLGFISWSIVATNIVISGFTVVLLAEVFYKKIKGERI